MLNTENRVAVLSIIVNESANINEVNNIITNYNIYIKARLGFPYDKRNVKIICLILDATEDVINSLAGKFGNMKNVSAKANYNKC